MSSKRITSQDVANAAGVSRTTVSLVLNKVPGVQITEETRQRVIAAAHQLGYVPDAAARALVSRRAQIIGLVLIRRHQHFTSDAFLTQTLDGMLETVHKHGMRLLIDIIEPEHQQEAYLRLVRAKHIDGLIFSGPRHDDEALLALQEEGIPVVLIGQLPESQLYSVDIDNRAASRMAVEHLLGLGHTRIACITNAATEYTGAEERLAGYREALNANGISYDAKYVRNGDFSPQSGYTQMKELLEENPPFTAVFVASDEVAVGAKAALYDHGMTIPNDIALVGFDDLPLAAYLEPPLTTIHVPAIEIARQASEVLIQLIKGELPTEKTNILEASLVVRDSCGAKYVN